MTKLSAVFCKKTLGSRVMYEEKKILAPKIHFWGAGESFFSDFGHFSEIEDFSKIEDFGC